MPNMIAYGAILLWPLISLALYLSMSAGRATIWTILAGYLLLPLGAGFDFPGIPIFDKSSIPNLCALILAALMARPGEFRWPRSRTINLLLLLLLISQFGTGLTNGDPILIGSVQLPGLGFREGLAFAASSFLQIIPFMLGAALLGSERGHRDILIALVLGALFYSLPILLEIRLSPYLAQRIYNFDPPGNFSQQVRGGGFRSMVFLGHGLLVSTFVAMALLAAIGLARVRKQLLGLPTAAIAAYIAVLLLLNKSLGAMVIALFLALPLIFLRQRQVLALAFGVALLLLTYPAVRSANILPLGAVTDIFRKISPERAESWAFRLRNEESLLAHAEDRPVFGWGSYGRNRVLVVTNAGTTVDTSITDGAWINTIGMYGWVGYIAFFGLLTYPFARAFRLRHRGISMASLALLAVHLLNLVDLIPNASLRPITWLIAGALAGMVAIARTATASALPALARRQPGRTREPALQD